MSLAGKTVVIIGGSSGIGFATAKAVLGEGGAVLIVGRSEAKLRDAKAQLGGKVRTASLDATSEPGVKRFFEQMGAFDHLVTTASGFASGPVRMLETATARSFFESKFWSQYYAAKYGAGHIRQGGSITFFAGIASRKPFPGLAVAAAIDGAIESLARTLAVELAPVRVNVVSPGLVATPVYDAMPEVERNALFQSYAAKLPVKRIGQPEDIAATVVYVMQNTYTTGTILDVDGGMMGV
jgi:NAD(P)-dependent dehydrogenase (short-subunit alcohol dehydrogenase family)